MGIEQSTQKTIPEKQCYFFGFPNILLIYNTLKDEFTRNETPNIVLKNMACVQINESTVYLSGGINENYQEVSNNVYRYNVDENIFRNLPSMNIPRYTHQLIYNKYDQKLYAMGGRSYGQGSEGILNSCECYDFQKGKWEMIAPMNCRRATFFAILYEQKIYAFGGYTDVRKRSKKIEKFENQKWVLLNLKLHYGIEQGVLYQNEKKELFILGGQSAEGIIDKHQVIDFTKQITYIGKTNNQKPRVLQKGIQIENYSIQFFGSDTLSIERGEISNLELRTYKNKLFNSISNECLKEFSIADYTFELGVIQKQIMSYIVIIQEDVIYRINKVYFKDQNQSKQQKFKEYIQSTQILSNKINLYSGALLLNDGSLIIMGGVNNQMNQISNDIIKLESNFGQFTKLAKMNQARYAFSYQLVDNYIYVAGGRYYGNDDQGILDSCERYNININQWEVLPKLNEKRCSSFMIQHNGKVLVAGGFNTFKTRINTIEIYNPDLKSWEMFGITLHNPIEACTFICKSNQNKLDFITFGGRQSSDIDNVIKYSIDFDQPIDHQIGNCQQLQSLKFKGSLLQQITIDNQLFIIHQNGQQLNMNSYQLHTFQQIETNINQQLMEILQELKVSNLGKLLIID
ncbi:unnamed protein product [Paramecium pentaurelia]|uniref:Kelch motif family protein n=1 Tax=Paramecium pentaurelia TaxID=43138 RepID=A0A8S1WI03_9CILI|nr:unnamed protein product [Paramecium pentaurelia]